MADILISFLPWQLAQTLFSRNPSVLGYVGVVEYPIVQVLDLAMVKGKGHLRFQHNSCTSRNVFLLHF